MFRKFTRKAGRTAKPHSGMPNRDSPENMLHVESLEQRVLLSVPPNPIDPSSGEQNLMDLINDLPLNDVYNALDHFPVPFTVVARAGDADPVVENWKAGQSFAKLDVDRSKETDGLDTGKGGLDIMVSVKTELEPTPHLKLEMERIGNAPYAEDVEILIAFPFDAFNDEILPGSPNLFMGFQTTAAGGAEGGYAPMTETIEFFPGIVAGTDHLFEVQFTTEGADNPLLFEVGHFDGDNLVGILNASAIGAHVETADNSVPESISVALDVSESFPLGGIIDSSLGLTWDASELADVTFGYLEDESSSTGVADFTTSVTVSQMPLHEELSISLLENPGGFTLSHRGSSVIDELTFEHTREDGLLILGSATDVPTEVDLTVDLAGTSVVLDVNANTLDLQLELIKDGGFINTGDVLGFDVGYLMVGLENAPDLTAGYDNVAKSFSVAATNPGESIDKVEVVLDDDASYGEMSGILTGLELPPSWNDVPVHHIFSFVEDGTHGTAAARLVYVESATLNFGTSDLSEAYQLITAQAAPMQFYAKFSEDSNFIPGDPNDDIEMTGDIDNIPAGEINWDYEAPFDFSYTIDPPQGIDSVHFYGHIGMQNFDFAAGDLPPVFAFSFDPEGSLSIVAEDGYGGPDMVGFAALRYWDEEGDGLKNTAGLLGENLHDARARVDEMPSFNATWSNDGTGASIAFDTVGNNVFMGGAQFIVSTEANLLTPLAEADANSADYAILDEVEDPDGYIQMGAGAFGIDEFTLDTSSSIDLYYDADSARLLTVTINRGFNGPFFPAGYNYDVDLMLMVNEIPQMFDFYSDLMTGFDYTATDEIDSLTLAGTVDDTNDNMDNGTDIDFELLGLPSEVNLDINPSDHARLTMDDSLDMILLSLSSDNNIFSSGYRLIEGSITDIPAKFDATWGGSGILVETKDAGDNPSPLGTLSARVSTSNVEAENEAKVQPFTLNGDVETGPILDGSNGTRIYYSPFQQEIDSRYYTSSNATSVFSCLRDIYAGSEELDDGEDHVIARMEGGSIDYASFQYSGFQHISWTPDAEGGQFVFRNPTPGLHPLFAGYEDGAFTTLQVSNIPDEIVVDIDITGAITYNASDDVDPSIDQIDMYQGPLPRANEGDNALRVIMNDTPSWATLTWDFSFSDGGVAFDSSNEFEVLFLNQSGNDRMVAGLQMKDISIGWGYGFDLSLDYDFPIFADLRIFEAHAGVYSSGVNGFFSLYKLIGDPQSLSTGTMPDGNEYVPNYTAMMRDFTELSLTVGIDVGLFPDFGVPEVDPELTLHGSFIFDIWTTETVDLTDTVPLFDIDYGFLNVADYIDNTPIHIIPLIDDLNIHIIDDLVITFDGFHDFGDHFDPFA